jgi:zinc protease
MKSVDRQMTAGRMPALLGAGLLALAAAMLSFAAVPALAQVSDVNQLQYPALHKIPVAQPKRIQLANGMAILLVEDHELPLIRGSANIHGGGREVPRDKAGLASIYGSSWRTGGTDSKTGDQLDDLLEARAAKLETSADADSSTIRMDVLKGDFDTVFPLFVELLQKPAFRQEKIDLAKTQLRSSISRRNDDPGSIVSREAGKLVYGDSPYAMQVEYATVGSITRDDLLAFHKRFVHPNNMIVGFVGDFDSAAMEKKLRAAFGAWPKGPKAPAAPAVGSGAKPGVYFIAKDDVNQTNLRVLELGAPLRNDPDYYAVDVMNTILSGLFSGRLMNHIRTQQGLAYGVGGGINMNYDHPGTIGAGLATKSGSTVQAIQSLRGEMNDLVTKPFTAEELKQAKDALLNAFVFTIDSPSEALSHAVTLEFYGYPADYWTKYPAMVEKVSAEDVSRVAKKYVKPEQLAVVVVGNEKEFDKPLSTLGAVTPIDITIPEPGAASSVAPRGAGSQPAGSPSSSSATPPSPTVDGAPLARKMRDFVGGKAKLDALQSMRQVSTVSAKTPGGMMDMEIDSLVRFPDSRRTIVKMPMGEMTMVSTPEGAFMVGPMGTQDMPGSQREMMRSEAKGDLLTVLRNLDNPKYTFAVTGTEKVGDVSAAVLEVNADGAHQKWFVDPATGRLLRKISQGRMGESTTDYKAWKSFDGLNLPVETSVTQNGENAGGMKVTTVEINPAVDAKLFVKP